MKPYPPLKALVTFDAVMQVNSFAEAATQLHVTPGAVGQQIRKLEQWLGVPLFQRQVRRIEPTQDALEYWHSIRPALTKIQAVSLALKTQKQHSVTISMPPSFAGCWFARRMSDFIRTHPDIQLHISANASMVDFDITSVDLAVRYFDGNDPKLCIHPLYPDAPEPWCSPQLAEQLQLKHPNDLARAHLIHHALHPHWTAWLAQHSTLSEAEQLAIPSLHFDQTVTALEAAIQGQGVILTSEVLTQKDSDRLIAPFAHKRLPLETGYFLVHPAQHALSPAASALKDWMLQAARE